MQSRALLLRLAALGVVVGSNASVPREANAATQCVICYPAESCLAQPVWEICALFACPTDPVSCNYDVQECGWYSVKVVCGRAQES